MRRSYFIALFVGFMVVGLAGYASIRAGVIPVALVNRTFISGRDFSDSVASIEHYYKELGKEGKASPVPSQEIMRATLDKLIENQLIERELQTKMGGKEVARSVSLKIDALEEVKSPQFGGAVMALYGISANRFRELVLEPKAREEIFEESLGETNKKFSEEVSILREEAKVRILIPGLHWENGGVIVRGG